MGELPAAGERHREGRPAEGALFKPFSLSLALYAEERREANGLRHGDFLRYRRYCTARLNRLRGSLELRQGRNRYQLRKLPVVIRDERVLLLVLTQAERAWSYAMQLKGENAAAAVLNPRVRRHAIQRLSKALMYAQLLENLCNSPTPSLLAPPPASSEAKASKGTGALPKAKEDAKPASGKKSGAAEEAPHALLLQPHALTEEEIEAYFASLACELVPLCDEKTKLEARAYRLSILAALLQEQERWEDARQTLEDLRQVYVHLKRVSSTQEREENLFKKLLEQVEPELRLCAFHSGGVASFAKAAAPGLAASDRKQGGAEGEKRMQTSPPLVAWRGDDVYVEADRPRMGVLGAVSLIDEVQILKTEDLASAASADTTLERTELGARLQQLSQEDAERLVERYGDLSSRFRLCVDLIHAEMLKHPDVSSWFLAEGYCLDISRCLEVERDIILLLRFFLNLRQSDEKPHGGAGGQHKQQSLRGDAGVRYASLLQQGVGKMMEEENLDEKRKLRMQQWAKIAKDSRALCLAVFDAFTGKLPEAYVLAAAVSSRSKALVPQPQVLPPDDPQGRLDIFFVALQRVVAELAHRYEARHLAAIVKEELKAAGSADEEIAAPTAPAFPLPGRRGAKGKAAPAQSGKSDGNREMLALAAQYVLPRLEPLPCKPVLFDLALASYAPPQLKARTEGGGKRAALRGFVKSLFGR
ncbi:putative signal recognition particle [Neospora caninum Liverpool]|uniref:Signal recognition particle subunit SRP68 n=1 Tax=Neospora caninum (strain Liverpool) TaxID=572307 RepID=F0VH47_NEOCL|nr:putative signal recognition particle [Neospora caninum Liverpool]CBZ53041.1 putative signal recognition particle [Neospora caninum Liverpool]CEL67025.1 TPA: signal recognition particle, putative [Neospora caninum Liverpool]|eukprot:XP_003883073.1 putative signal recognition particle [Neospora caninum Liverpool]